MTSWTIQLIWRQSPTFSAVSFSLLASLRGFFSFLFFVAAGSDCFSAVFKYRYLSFFNRDTPGTSVPVSRVFFIPGKYTNLSHSTNLLIWPFLNDYSHLNEVSTSTQYYWPRGYEFSGNSNLSPYYLVPSPMYDITVPNDWTSEDAEAMTSYCESLPSSQQAAITGFLCTSVTAPGYTNHVYYPTYAKVGTIRGGGVVTYSSDGVPEVRYSDSSGYISGYRMSGAGQYDPEFYRIVDNQVVILSNVQTSNSSSLSYDPDTGHYSFDIPDYSTQLAEISRNVEAIRNNPFLVDLSGVEIPPSEVTVNPEITVNPPEVTVNPTVTVTPDVTVNVTNPGSSLTVSDIAQGVRQGIATSPLSPEGGTLQNDVKSINRRQQTISSNLESISDQFSSSSVDDFDTTNHQYTQEEQSLLDISNGWNTQIPGISNACNVAFNAAFGSVPSIPASNLVPISGINILGFEIVVDLRPYASMFAWFRAFVLMLEVVWFIDSMWRTCVNAFKV